MSVLDGALLAEKAALAESYLQEVEKYRPADAAGLKPKSLETYAVVLNLLMATQAAIDAAAWACVRFGFGSPDGYADAFERLANAGKLDRALADRLKRASGFRNLTAHQYHRLDLARVHDAAVRGPADLRALFVALSRAA